MKRKNEILKKLNEMEKEMGLELTKTNKNRNSLKNEDLKRSELRNLKVLTDKYKVKFVNLGKSIMFYRQKDKNINLFTDDTFTDELLFRFMVDVLKMKPSEFEILEYSLVLK